MLCWIRTQRCFLILKWTYSEELVDPLSLYVWTYSEELRNLHLGRCTEPFFKIQLPPTPNSEPISGILVYWYFLMYYRGSPSQNLNLDLCTKDYRIFNRQNLGLRTWLDTYFKRIFSVIFQETKYGPLLLPQLPRYEASPLDTHFWRISSKTTKFPNGHIFFEVQVKLGGGRR